MFSSDISSKCHSFETSIVINKGGLLCKVYMKRNQYFNILKVQHFRDITPKFEPCLKKIGDSITPENGAILLSKMVFESCVQNVM